jgi:hypothetical protein
MKRNIQGMVTAPDACIFGDWFQGDRIQTGSIEGF